jgi:hypothetical protein
MREIVSPLDGFGSPFGTRARLKFSPASLFAAGEQGAWFEPSPTTCFTDTAGTTSAQVGQAVALMLDKSKGLALGPELVTNGTFDANTNGWTLSSGGTFVSEDGVGIFTRAVVGATVFQSIPAEAQKFYEVSVTLVSTASARAAVDVVSAFPPNLIQDNSPPGIYRGVFRATSNIITVFLGATANGVPVGYDNISVRELKGNHATQPTAAARPILGRVPASGRRNLLLNTDSLSTQTRTVRAVEHVLSFSGTGTVTLSGASTAGPLVGTGENDRVHIAFTPSAGSLTLTVSGSVNFAQLEEA